MMRFYNQLQAKFIQALSSDTAEASRAALQYIDCLRAAVSLALESFWGEDTQLTLQPPS